MATGLQRDAIVILRMDGEDLLDFINGPSYENEMISIFSKIDMANNEFSVSGNILKALQLLSVDHGMPPVSDSWVMSNIVEPALQSCKELDGEQTMTKEIMLEEFKKVTEKLAQLLKAEPVIVAHNEQIFDGNGIKRLISSTFEFNKALEVAMKDLHEDDNGKVPKESLWVVLDLVGPATGLPPTGAIDQVDRMFKEAIETRIIEGERDKMIGKEGLKKLVTEVLEIVMLKLEETPLTVSSNSVLHESLSTSSEPSIT